MNCSYVDSARDRSGRSVPQCDWADEEISMEKPSSLEFSFADPRSEDVCIQTNDFDGFVLVNPTTKQKCCFEGKLVSGEQIEFSRYIFCRKQIL